MEIIVTSNGTLVMVVIELFGDAFDEVRRMRLEGVLMFSQYCHQIFVHLFATNASVIGEYFISSPVNFESQKSDIQRNVPGLHNIRTTDCGCILRRRLSNHIQHIDGHVDVEI